MKMENYNIIFTGLQSWDIAIGSNAKNIALEMSRRNRVMYVNPATTILQPPIEQRIRHISSSLTVVDTGVRLIPLNFMRSNWLFDQINKHNNRQFASAIASVAQTLGMKEFIHINDNDIFRSYYLREYLHPRLSVYYRRDWLLSVPYWSRHAPRLEPVLAAKSDLVLTNSPYLAQTIEHANARSYYVGQGVDLSAYDPTLYPPVSGPRERPVVGYVGAISSLRLDADMLQRVVELCPELDFVMVGAQDEYFTNHAIHKLPNIDFTGNRAPEELPRLISQFDVCINPQAINPITIGNYPRKIDEYLAMGKSVVATDTPTMQIFREYVALADTPELFARMVGRYARSPCDAQSCTDFAKSHSWSQSVALMYKYMGTPL